MKIAFIGIGMLWLSQTLYAQTRTYEDCFAKVDTLDGLPVYSSLLEEQPTFEGGLDKFYKIIGRRLWVGKIERYKGLDSRKAGMSFVIDTTGKVRNLCLCGDFYHLPEDFVDEISHWKPGRIRGKAVPVWLFLPIRICWR